MDIEALVKEDRKRGWDVTYKTQYEVQEKAVDGMSWWTLGTYDTLEDAVDRKMEYIRKWWPTNWEIICDELAGVRIVMRHTVEVVL